MEIHSVRVRKTEANGLESYGLGDIKISIDNSSPGEDGFGSNTSPNSNESGPNGFSSKRTLTGYDSQNISKIVWPSIKYEGDRYINLSNTQIIGEYVKTNSLLFAQNYGYDAPDAGLLYEVIQEPWNPNAPLTRRFGYDPYYFNNNSKAYIRWFYYPKIGYEFGAYEVFNNGTASPVTDIAVTVIPLIDGEEDVDFPKFDLYFSPSNYNLTSSINYLTTQATTVGLVDSDGKQYPKDGTVLTDDDYMRYEGGVAYSDQNLNEINTPSTIKKRVDIVSPELSDGVNIEQTFIITSDNTLSYPGDKITPKNWNYNIKDTQILQEIVDLWKKKVPEYDLKLSSPDYQSPTSSIQYKSPFGTASKAEERDGFTSSGTASVKLNVVFPTEFNPVVRETLTQFSVWIGDPQLDDPVDGFIFQEDNSGLEISTEYTESEFSGTGENFIAESLDFDEAELERLLLEEQFNTQNSISYSSTDTSTDPSYNDSSSTSTSGGGGSTTNSSNETKPKPDQKDIDKIKEKSYLTKQEKDGLVNRNADFIKSWANGFTTDKSAFIWANQVYRTKTGKRILEYNPLKKAHKVKKGGNIAFEYPTRTSSGQNVDKGTKVGLARDFTYNDDNIWLYFPDNGGWYKWGIASNFELDK
jgi:hypothetical protein